jgi:hypothetical protein
VDVLALHGEDAGLQTLQYQVVCALDLPVHAQVGDCCPFYLDVVIIIEIEELLPGELGVVVGDDRVGDSK